VETSIPAHQRRYKIILSHALTFYVCAYQYVSSCMNIEICSENLRLVWDPGRISASNINNNMFEADILPGHIMVSISSHLWDPTRASKCVIIYYYT
jgi:hypothetical protein